MKIYTFVMTNEVTTWEEQYAIEDDQDPQEFIDFLLDNFREYYKSVYGRESNRECVDFYPNL